eukprot:COSAG01_NODE_72652_length_252_cov_0.993464_1_plen_42_part_01
MGEGFVVKNALACRWRERPMGGGAARGHAATKQPPPHAVWCL